MIPQKTLYTPEILKASTNWNLPFELVESLVLVESSGHAYAYRYEPAFWTRYMEGHQQWQGMIPQRVSASYGLMQIMFPVAQELGYPSLDPEHLFVPSINLEYGCKKLSRLMDWAKGNQAQALCAYNGGKGGNSKAPFRNQSYADKVLMG